MSWIDDVHKVVPVAAGLLGASLAASYGPEPMSRKRWYATLASGVAFAFFLAPMTAAATRHYWPLPWIPQDGSLEGVAGLMLGIFGIHLTGALTSLGTRFSSDPLAWVPWLRRFRK